MMVSVANRIIEWSDRLSQMLSARLTDTAGDDVADIVLGPRLCDLCAALGVPVGDWWQISRWADRCGDGRELDAFGSYIDVAVAERCWRPGDDLISDLVAHEAEADGRGLTADEIRAVVVGLVLTAAPAAPGR
jgi:cytochrome P450